MQRGGVDRQEYVMMRYASKNLRQSLRPRLLGIGVAAVLALPVAGLGTGAGAQGTGGLGIPEAPVGHRQPTQADLPPSVRQEEQGNVPAPDNPPAAQNNARGRSGSKRDSGSTPSTGAYGQIPSICTGC
jgi:hypothetical protein